jgi:hypothetical protein
MRSAVGAPYDSAILSQDCDKMRRGDSGCGSAGRSRSTKKSAVKLDLPNRR